MNGSSLRSRAVIGADFGRIFDLTEVVPTSIWGFNTSFNNDVNLPLFLLPPLTVLSDCALRAEIRSFSSSPLPDTL